MSLSPENRLPENIAVTDANREPAADAGVNASASVNASADARVNASASYSHRRPQTPAEERFNSKSHAVLASLLLLSMPLTLVYVHRTSTGNQLIRTLSVLVYLICILTMLGSSSIYHALPATSRYKRTLNRIDHISIFLAIAGSYTPIALGTIDQTIAVRVLLAEWGLAAIGIVFKLSRFRTGRANAIASTVLYLAMGWLIVIDGPQFVHIALPGLIICMVVGGLAYTAGVIFYSIAKPRMHNIWHICVAIGVISHYIGIVFYI